MKTIQTQSVDFDNLTFKGGSGTIYHIQADKIYPKRFKVYEEVCLKAGYGAGYVDIFNTFKKIYNHLTTGNELLKAHNAAIRLAYEAMVGTKEAKDKRHNSVLHLCALFCNAENEDITDYDEKVITAKIEDFENAKIPMNDFFLLMNVFIDGYQQSLREIEELSKRVAIESNLKFQGVKE